VALTIIEVSSNRDAEESSESAGLGLPHSMLPDTLRMSQVGGSY